MVTLSDGAQNGYHPNIGLGVAYDHFCGRGVFVLVPVSHFGILFFLVAVKVQSMAFVVLTNSSELHMYVFFIGRGVLLPLLVALCGLLFLVVVQTMFSVMRTIVTELHMYVLFGRGVQIMVVVTMYGLYT